MRKTFTEIGWEHYVYWERQDRKTWEKINRLLQSIERDGVMNGIGKPERLKYGSGYSRRIDDTVTAAALTTPIAWFMKSKATTS